ncbi:MAG TPA: cupin domain-containing protein [Candidatus Acidoferrales bacterium]|nr:cupin domain-containing protein [Candidatus Acidoferrales bacterium]
MRNSKKENLYAQASNLADLINYQEGAVVSRTLIDKTVGTITLFAFDDKQGLSEHTAPYDAMVYVLDGEVEVKIAGKPVPLKQGEMTIMPANQPHALAAKTRFKMLLVMIKS